MSIWKNLTHEDQLQELLEASKNENVLIFKDSPTCYISKVVKNQLEKDTANSSLLFHLINVKDYRKLSNKIAETLEVTHESPQILVIHNDKCIYHTSHFDIKSESISEILLK